MAVFADDFFAVDGVATVDIAYDCIDAASWLRCFELGDEKARFATTHLDFGRRAFVGFIKDVAAAIPDGRRGALIIDLSGITKSNSLTPGHDAEIRGKLGFAQPFLSGEVDRAQRQPLSNRHHSLAIVGNRPLSAELKKMLFRGWSVRCAMRSQGGVDR